MYHKIQDIDLNVERNNIGLDVLVLAYIYFENLAGFQSKTKSIFIRPKPFHINAKYAGCFIGVERKQI